MSILFKVDSYENYGSLKDIVSNTLPSNNNVKLIVTEKGFASRFFSGDSLDGYGPQTGVKTIALILRPTADTTLIQDDGVDVLEITGGSYAGTGLTATYVNNIATSEATLGQWQLVICEFSAGVDIATDLEIVASAPIDIAAIWFDDTLLTAGRRAAAYQEFLNRRHIVTPMVTNRLTPVAQFDGVSNFVDCNSNVGNFQWDDDFTIGAWIKAKPQDNGIIVGNAWSSYGYHFRIVSSSMIRFILVGDPGGFTYKYSDSLDFSAYIGKWVSVHVRFTALTKTPEIFIAGILSVSTTVSQNIVTSIDTSQHTYIGAAPDAGPRFNGQIRGVSIYDRALSNAEILDLSRGGDVGRTSPIAYYPLDEATGITARELIKGNPGTYTGPQPHGQSHHNQIISWDAANMPADGQSFSSGPIDRDIEVGSGTFIREELLTGKQIRCTSPGTLKIYGVNLSEFIGHGYIQALGGSLSGDAGKTVDDATSVSFANNTLTFTLSPGQTITDFVVRAIPKT